MYVLTVLLTLLMSGETTEMVAKFGYNSQETCLLGYEYVLENGHTESGGKMDVIEEEGVCLFEE